MYRNTNHVNKAPAGVSSALPPAYPRQAEAELCLPQFPVLGDYSSDYHYSHLHRSSRTGQGSFRAAPQDHLMMDSRSCSSNSSIGDEGAAFQAASFANTPVKKRTGNNNSLGPIPPCSSVSSSFREEHSAAFSTAAPPSSPTTSSSFSSFAAKVYRWEPYNSSVVTLRCPKKEEELVQELKEAEYQRQMEECVADTHWIRQQTLEEAEQHVAPPSTPVAQSHCASFDVALPVDSSIAVPPSYSSSSSSFPEASDPRSTDEHPADWNRKKLPLFRSGPTRYCAFKENPNQAALYADAKAKIEQKRKTTAKTHFEPALSNIYYMKLRRQSCVINSCKSLRQSLPIGFTSDEEALNYVVYGYYNSTGTKDVPRPGDIMIASIPGFKDSAMKLTVEDVFQLHCIVPLNRSFTHCTRYVKNTKDQQLDRKIIDVALDLVARAARLEFTLARKPRADVNPNEAAFCRPVSLTLDLLELVDVELHTPADKRKNKEITIFYREKADASKIYKTSHAAYRQVLLTDKKNQYDVIDTQCICVHLNKLIKRSKECNCQFVAVRFVHIGDPVLKKDF